jgi:hypothetical protein
MLLMIFIAHNSTLVEDPNGRPSCNYREKQIDELVVFGQFHVNKKTSFLLRFNCFLAYSPLEAMPPRQSLSNSK